MAHQTFFVGDVFTGNVPCYALGAYHPLWLKHEGGKTKNPAFDQYSQHVLNLKFPNTQWFKGSVIYCANHLIKFLKANHAGVERAEFLIVPSSTQGNTSVALDRIATAIAKGDKRFSYRPGALSRTKTIAKLATGGDRSVGVHLASMDYKHDAASPPVKIILDDVATSGNSLSGAIMVVQQYDQNATFIPVVFGKTTHD
jgi:hypothetical protein